MKNYDTIMPKSMVIFPFIVNWTDTDLNTLMHMVLFHGLGQVKKFTYIYLMLQIAQVCIFITACKLRWKIKKALFYYWIVRFLFHIYFPLCLPALQFIYMQVIKEFYL